MSKPEQRKLTDREDLPTRLLLQHTVPVSRYQSHLLAFVDLLGFSEAIKDHERSEAILSLLKTIMKAKGEFFAHENRPQKGYRTVRPAITAFSDNLVISFCLDEMTQPRDFAFAFVNLQNLIGFLAWTAFSRRLLVRGGIALDPAYHKRSIVFGPALVEAYEAERSLAIYPRVVLARSVMQSPFEEKIRNLYWTYHDGVPGLGYTTRFITRTERNSLVYNPRVNQWIRQVRDTISEEIAALEAANNEKAAQKWAWFRENLEASFKRSMALYAESWGEYPFDALEQ